MRRSREAWLKTQPAGYSGSTPADGPEIVRIEKGAPFQDTLIQLLNALEKAGVIRLEGDYASFIRDGSAFITFPGEHG